MEKNKRDSWETLLLWRLMEVEADEDGEHSGRRILAEPDSFVDERDSPSRSDWEEAEVT